MSNEGRECEKIDSRNALAGFGVGERFFYRTDVYFPFCCSNYLILLRIRCSRVSPLGREGYISSPSTLPQSSCSGLDLLPSDRHSLSRIGMVSSLC